MVEIVKSSKKEVLVDEKTQKPSQKGNSNNLLYILITIVVMGIITMKTVEISKNGSVQTSENGFRVINGDLKKGQRTYFDFKGEKGSGAVDFIAVEVIEMTIESQEGEIRNTEDGDTVDHIYDYHTGVWITSNKDTKFKIVIKK